MKNIKRELIEQKLNLVVEKLMNLGGPENEAELKAIYAEVKSNKGLVALITARKKELENG